MISNSRLGAELSFNLIIASIIAVIVLIVMVLILSGKASFFGNSLSDCQNLGGTCSEGDNPCPSGTAPVYKTSCNQGGTESSAKAKCCVKTEI